MELRITSAIIFLIWVVLVLIGKGGLVHILLLSAVGIAFVDLMSIVRSKLTK
ncbi:hypothetical protein BH10ACI2_BH10ACI2_14300 [soil metagenome]